MPPPAVAALRPANKNTGRWLRYTGQENPPPWLSALRKTPAPQRWVDCPPTDGGVQGPAEPAHAVAARLAMTTLRHRSDDEGHRCEIRNEACARTPPLRTGERRQLSRVALRIEGKGKRQGHRKRRNGTPWTGASRTIPPLSTLDVGLPSRAPAPSGSRLAPALAASIELLSSR